MWTCLIFAISRCISNRAETMTEVNRVNKFLKILEAIFFYLSALIQQNYTTHRGKYGWLFLLHSTLLLVH